MNILNMLGKPCPIPVVEAKKALQQPDASEIVVLVDNFISVQNLEKMATGLGYGFSFEQKGDAEFAVTILAGGDDDKPAAGLIKDTEISKKTSNLSFVLTADQLGISDEAPGQKLMNMLLLTLPQLDTVPEYIILLNTAVRLAADGAESLEELRSLSAKGTKILLCGACVQYYELTDKIGAGEVSNMLEIAGVISSAARVVTF